MDPQQDWPIPQPFMLEQGWGPASPWVPPSSLASM
jgi:hypothetical protein